VKNIFSKNDILGFSKQFNHNNVEYSFNLLQGIISETMNKIKARNSLINDYEVLFANEIFTEKEFVGSTLDVFLCIDALQLEINYQNNLKKESKFIPIVKNFFKNFKKNLKLNKKEKKKKKKKIKSKEKEQNNLINENHVVEIDYTKYDILSFLNEFKDDIIKNLYEGTTIKFISNGTFLINGYEEFGIPINIIPIFINSSLEYTFYNISTKKAIKIDFDEREDNCKVKNLLTYNSFDEQVRIFNNLYWNIIKNKPNQIAIESLIYNCPNILFESNDCYNTTVAIVNFLKNTQFKKIKSILNDKNYLIKENLANKNISSVIKFIKTIKIEKNTNF